MVSSIGSVFNTSTTTSANSTQAEFDKSTQTYLSLFLAQLKNQDPTQPFSTEAMSQQMSMLTQTQQSIQTNKNLEQLISMNTNAQATSMSSFIGKDVEYVSDEFYADKTGAEFSFNVKNPGSVKIQIYDLDGKEVFSHTGTSNAGKFNYVWDMQGTEGTYGAGRYNVKVTSTDSSGATSDLPVTVKSKVTGIDFTDSGEPKLVMGYGDGKVKVGLDLVAFVSEAATANSGTTTANNSTTSSSSTTSTTN